MTSEKFHYPNARHLSQLYCGKVENLAKIEDSFGVKLATRDDWIQVDGTESKIRMVEELFSLLDLGRSQGLKLRDSDFNYVLAGVLKGEGDNIKSIFEEPLLVDLKRSKIVPKTINQKRYLEFMHKYDIVFGVGPAGTGKTYLAMAAALEALLNNKVDRIIITRPAVEAGEALGFLPGDLREKILPYLRPIYDAMYDMLGSDDAAKLMEKDVVEIAPLAYMRGRTLSKAYIILDEAQNTTHEQMMMFLTRLGEGSRMIITGDITQVDLPRSKMSGLKQAVQVLNKVKGIKLFYFDKTDVVRHTLVSSIIDAYESFLAENN